MLYVGGGRKSDHRFRASSPQIKQQLWPFNKKHLIKVRPDYTWVEYLLPQFCIKWTTFMPKFSIVSSRNPFLETARNSL